VSWGWLLEDLEREKRFDRSILVNDASACTWHKKKTID
jgi:hypothetical protein